MTIDAPVGTVTTYDFSTDTVWTVPLHDGPIRFEVVGAVGGTRWSAYDGYKRVAGFGGRGGRLLGYANIAAGTSLDIQPGQPGVDYPGSGVGGGPSGFQGGDSYAGGGGGGGSALIGPSGLIFVVGGGGGACDGAFGSGYNGGDGGVATDTASGGDGGGGYGGGARAGGGGTLSAPGAGGTGGGNAGSGHLGGDGGGSYYYGAGGGGGGYYGGGGGACPPAASGGAGGGGSTWFDNSILFDVALPVAGAGTRFKVTLDYLGDWVDRRKGWAVGRLAW